MIDRHHGWNKSYKPLTLGYILSLLLTFASYRIVTKLHLTSTELTLTVFGFAILQGLIQLVFFLHLGVESKPYWNLITFLFMVLIIVIVVGGSLWIMANLHYNPMITKPGIIFGNLVTMAGGFALGTRGEFQIPLFLATFLGLMCIIASACVFNNYLDREMDEKMERTKNRPLVLGLISGRNALLFASILLFIGIATLLLFTNPLTLSVALFGFVTYVLIYTLIKAHTASGTLIGSFAGAVPPVVGYCAASSHFDLGALILFVMISMWQMPHFYAIALYRIDDYREASIPVLPLKRGVGRTKVHMLLYIVAFTLVSASLTLFHYTGIPYLIVSTVLGCAWLGLCLKGFKAKEERKWARQMFAFSLIVVMLISILMVVS